MLCDLMRGTRVCGAPESWFRRQSIESFVKRFGLEVARNDPGFDAAYLAAVLEAGRDGTETFGLRLMWPTVPELSIWLDRLFPGLTNDAARHEAAFGPAHYVYLFRRDPVAQAVSRLKAEQSGLWHVNSDGSERERIKPHEQPVYDFAALNNYVAESLEANESWEDWFAANGIAPIRIAYEDLAENPSPLLGALLTALGRDAALAGAAAPQTAVLSDGLNAEWVARYRRETGTID